jgi:hypothetical protein
MPIKGRPLMGELQQQRKKRKMRRRRRRRRRRRKRRRSYPVADRRRNCT